MSMTDPIADLLSRIRTAYLAKHDRLDLPASKVKQGVCQILKEEGYIESFQLIGESTTKKSIRIVLRYTPEGQPMIRHLQRVSTPGRRVYRAADEVRPVLNGIGVGIVSTSSGLVTDKKARELRIGGEILCEVW